MKALLVITLVSSLVALAGTPNLVPNPGFEQGDRGVPQYWTAPDNLTVFWESCGIRGKGLRLDTDVYRKEWEEHILNPTSPITKTPTSGKKYNTVAGSVGVAVYSHPIPVESDAWYLLEYDVKAAAGQPFVYLKGYSKCSDDDAQRAGTRWFFKPDPQGASFSLLVKGGVGQEKRAVVAGDYAQVFRRRFITYLDPQGRNRWHHVKGVVHLQKRHHIDTVLLEIYAYWPAGEYYFDNLSLRRVSPETAAKIKAERTKYSQLLPRP
jgi:hypothetical protein